MEGSVDQQIGSVWRGLMGGMTAQGATREQIAQVAAATSAQILGLTEEALWPPNSDVIPEEGEHFLALHQAGARLREYLEKVE